MAISSTRQTNIQYSGDLEAGFLLNAAVNAESPGEVWPYDLTAGDNAIYRNINSNSVATSVTIVPPAGNEATITLKGANGDTGVKLHSTDPTTLALAEDFDHFVLTVSDNIIGMRFYWA